MSAMAEIIYALLTLGLRLLEKIDAAHADEFRRRVAADGSGVLLSQLNPGHSESSGAYKPETTGIKRDSGRVDG